jgi:hypothetical protein
VSLIAFLDVVLVMMAVVLLVEEVVTEVVVVAVVLVVVEPDMSKALDFSNPIRIHQILPNEEE